MNKKLIIAIVIVLLLVSTIATYWSTGKKVYTCYKKVRLQEIAEELDAKQKAIYLEAEKNQQARQKNIQEILQLENNSSDSDKVEPYIPPQATNLEEENDCVITNDFCGKG